MWKKRLAETLAVAVIGDGVLALLAPREHSLLWEVGPQSSRRVALWFAENPGYMRGLGAIQVALGVWMALRQYRGRP